MSDPAGDPVLGFRPLRRGDLALVSAWIGAPHVAPWWREDPAAEAVEARYGPSIDGGDTTEVFVVTADGAPVGMVQRFRLADERSWAASLAPALAGDPADAAGIDYLIGAPELTGRGLGPRLIGAFSAATFERYPEVVRLVVSVARDNRRSWRALEKAAYRRVWSGDIVSDDPSDEGPSVVYVLPRPDGTPTATP